MDYPRHVKCPQGHTVIVQSADEERWLEEGRADVHVIVSAEEPFVGEDGKLVTRKKHTRLVRGLKSSAAS